MKLQKQGIVKRQKLRDKTGELVYNKRKLLMTKDKLKTIS